MSDMRLPQRAGRPQPRARFRCPVCQRFVTATDHGVCAGCGRAPPAATSAGRGPDPRAWSRAARAAGTTPVTAGTWLAIVLASLAIGLACAGLALRLW